MRPGRPQFDVAAQRAGEVWARSSTEGIGFMPGTLPNRPAGTMSARCAARHSPQPMPPMTDRTVSSSVVPVRKPVRFWSTTKYASAMSGGNTLTFG